MDKSGSQIESVSIDDLEQCSKTITYSNWNRWDFSNVNPVVKRSFYGTISFLFIFICIVIPVLLGSCSKIVPFDSNAVVISHTGKIEKDPVGPGRIFRPAGFRIQLYPRFDSSIEFSTRLGNPISVRVEDGQTISLDISLQFFLAKSSLVNIYKVHKGGFTHTLSQVLYSSLRDVAAGYPSEDFFSRRAEIEDELRNNIEIEATKRAAVVTGFQVRGVELPTSLNERLTQIQLRQQDARAGQARLELDRIYAESNRTVLQISTERTKLKTEIEQETKVMLAQINQERDRILETTLQKVSAIEHESTRNVSIFNKQTDILLEGIDLEETVVAEDTRRRVEEVTVSLQTNASIYHQETENIQLSYENEIAMIEESTLRNVSTIYADLIRTEQMLLADLDNYETTVQKQSQLRSANHLSGKVKRNQGFSPRSSTTSLCI